MIMASPRVITPPSSDVSATYKADNIDASRKISNRHQTVVKEAEIIINAAKPLEPVSKIVLGIIHHLGHGRPRLKMSDTRAGMVVKVRGTSAFQELHTYTHDREKVRTAILTTWEKE